MLPEPLAQTAFRIAGHAFTFHDALCLAAAVLALLLGAWILRRERKRQAALLFCLLAGSAAIWLASLAFMRSAPGPEEADRWARASLLGLVFAPVLLFRFASELLDEPEPARRPGGLFWLAAGGVAAVGMGTQQVVAGVSESPLGYRLDLTLPGLATVTALVAASAGLSLRELLRAFRRAASGSQRREIGTFLAAFALGSLVLVDGLPALGVAIYPFGYLSVLGALGLGAWGLRRFQLAAYRPGMAAREILESLGDPLLVVDPDREIHFANYEACRLFDYGRRQLPGTSLRALVGSGEGPEELLRDLTRDDMVRTRELTLRTASGEPVEVSVTASALPGDGDERAGTVLVARDISDRLQAERKLRESEERYALAARGANDGLWDWDLRSDEIHYSERWAEMLGLDPDEPSGEPEEWFGRIHEDHRDRVRAEVAAHLRGDTAQLRTEYRIRHEDGSWRWMLCRGLAVHDDDSGDPVRMAGSQRDVTVRRRAQEQLRHEALHDELTGLPNRTHLQDRLEDGIEAFREDPSRLFALLHLGVNRFARINETYGHSEGDRVLEELAGRLHGGVATGDHAFLARLSGDEFALLLTSIEGAEEAVEAAMEIDRLLYAEPFRVEDREIHLSATIGATVARSDYERPDQVLRDAEIAMNSAKSDERRGFALFRPSMRKMPANMLALESDLRRALSDGDELFLEYQPIVDFAAVGGNGGGDPGPARLVAVEGLVRWRHRGRGRLGAGAFVPMAEEVGLSGDLGRWVLREACRQMAAWRQTLGERAPAKVHVNLSPEEIADRKTVDLIGEILEAEGLPGECLDVEITEQVLVSRPDEAARNLEAIRELGVAVSIDDFGTGHASFGHLRRFPADTVKIDREFVAPVVESQRDREIIRSILELAGSLELNVITEGVEDREQTRILRGLGIRLGQGYFWSRPLAADDLARRAGGPVAEEGRQRQRQEEETEEVEEREEPSA